jgi:hypothetical protein
MTIEDTAKILLDDVKRMLSGEPSVLTKEVTPNGTYLKMGDEVILYIPYIPLQMVKWNEDGTCETKTVDRNGNI